MATQIEERPDGTIVTTLRLWRGDREVNPEVIIYHPYDKREAYAIFGIPVSPVRHHRGVVWVNSFDEGAVYLGVDGRYVVPDHAGYPYTLRDPE